MSEEEKKKICPFLVDYNMSEMSSYCYKEQCAMWVEGTKKCGFRLDALEERRKEKK